MKNKQGQTITFGSMETPTPKWAKKIRNTALKIGGGLVAVGSAVLALPFSLPVVVTTYAGYAILYGGAIGSIVATLSQAIGIKDDAETPEQLQ
jgi:hypothetical protein